MPGEESLYDLVRSVVAAADRDAAARRVLEHVATEADRELIGPLFGYSNEGVAGRPRLGNAGQLGRFRHRLT